jgi:glycosyltransferase involved in cell wall biosynthesis
VAGFHYTSSQEAAESAPYGFGRPACVVPNGFSEASWRRDEAAGSAWRTQLDIPREAKLLLYAGRLHHKKGLEILPEALSRVMAARGGAMIHLVLVGPDEDGTQGRLNEAARRAGFGGRMHWVSTVPQAELCAAYSAADLFVLPSLHENFGNAAIEALVCGCPALVSAETACLEYGAGLGMSGVAQRTPEAWTTAILSELDQSPSRLGAKERAALIQKVGLAGTASAMVSFYESLL